MMQTVKKIDILSMGKFMAVYMALAGLLIGIIQVMVLSFVISMVSMLPVEGIGTVTVSGGWWVVILYPILFGILGFIAGALCALLYNLIAKISGGIKLDLETEGSAQPLQPAITTQATGAAQQRYQQYQQYYQQRR